ncbi:MAG: hypothetical protein ACRD2J_02135 [Thermoanaerobaculia bacterium]
MGCRRAVPPPPVESGSHRDLMHAGGYYASLIARQTKGLLPFT